MPNTIADDLQALNTARLNIADAITNKGGTVNTDKRFSLFPNDINTIPTANLTTLNVTENGTYYSGEETVVTSSTFPVVVNDSNGTPVRHADVDGNTVQSGTPSPTTPIQPQGCGDRTGNLAPPLTEWVDGYITDAGTINVPTGTNKEKTSDYISVKAGAAYTFSIENGFQNSPWRAIGWYTQDKTFISRASGNASDALHTNAPSNAVYCRLSYRTQGRTTNPIFNLGTEALPYEPYGYKLNISNGGENLIDVYANDTSNGYINNALLRASGDIYTPSYGFISEYQPINESVTYTLNTGGKTGESQSICFYTSDKQLISGVAYASRTTITFTTPQGARYFRCTVMRTQTDTESYKHTMLNLGVTALPYSPYIEPTETSIYLGEVQTTRRIKKLVLGGTENWAAQQAQGGNRFVLSIQNARTSDTSQINSICSHFPLLGTGETFAKRLGYTIVNSSIYLRYDPMETTTEFKSYLAAQYAAGTPVTVWYVLAEPETGIVNEPLMKIGDYADSLSVDIELPLLQNAKNNIDVNTTVKPSSASFTYNKLSEYAGYDIVNVNVPIPTKYVTEITITENIIEDNMFKNYTALETAILPNTLTTIGIGSFENCTSLTLTTLPDTVTTINDNAFNNCASLSLTTLPTSLITIGNNAFFGTAMAGEIHIPNTVTTIGDNIFSNTGITDIIFDGTPTTISSNAFSNISSLETIYVPWAEGTVTGAPWGAGSNVTILYVNTNWHDIREVVRKGKAQQFYPLGTVLYDDFDSTNTNRTAYEVVAYNHFNDSSLSAQGYVDSMTLCEKYVRYGVAVDAIEALMAVTTELPAGTYKFTIPNYDATYGGNKTYYFVLNNSVPVGGQLVLNWPYQAVPRTITTYASATATTSIESYGTSASPLPEWVEGTSPEAIDLGTVTMSATATTNTYGIFNHIHRARYGSNNYAQSGIRQYMNATTTNWWTPQTIFDRRHGLNSSTGILGTLNTDFVNVLATPSITNIANNTFEYQSLNGDTFTLNTEYTINTDKLFLLSHSEVNLSASPTLGTVLDYYIDADNTKRIKYDRTNNSTARYWWFRTPYPTNANYVRHCRASGALDSYNATNGIGCVPACIIQ